MLKNSVTGEVVADGTYFAEVLDGEVVAMNQIDAQFPVERGAPPAETEPEPEPPVTNLIRSWQAGQSDGRITVTADAVVTKDFELRMHCSTQPMPGGGDGITAPLVDGAYTTKSQFVPGIAVNVWLYWKNTVTGAYILADGPQVVRIPDALPPSPPPEPIATVGPGELEAAVKASEGEIHLRDQHYGSLKLSGMIKKDLTIRANGSTFDYVELENCEGIHLDGFTVDRGDLNAPRAVYFRGGRNLSFINGDVRGATSGIVVFGTDEIRVRDNRVDHVRSDFFKFSGVNGGVISGNEGGGHLFPNGTDHADFMQFQGAACRDLLVLDNTYIAQNNVRAQGIYAEKFAPITNCTFARNIIVTGKVRLLSVAEGSGNVMDDNLCVMIRNGQNQTGRIFAPGGTAQSGNRVIQTGRLGMTLEEVMAL